MQNLTGARIATQLFSAEDAIDRTLGETAKLITSMCEARIAHRLPAIAGQRVIGSGVYAYLWSGAARRLIWLMYVDEFCPEALENLEDWIKWRLPEKPNFTKRGTTVETDGQGE